jgi:hypothetical protein
MKRLPLGIQDFRKLREEGLLYIDKTQDIYRLIQSGYYYFLSRPRRFGKSLLLSMHKEIFLGSKELFEGLRIKDLMGTFGSLLNSFARLNKRVCVIKTSMP